MKKIRIGCFETNSSSYHSMMIVNADFWREFERGNVWLELNSITLVHKDEVPDKFKGDSEKAQELRQNNYYNTQEDSNGYYVEYEAIDTYYADGTPAVAAYIEVSND